MRRVWQQMAIVRARAVPRGLPELGVRALPAERVPVRAQIGPCCRCKPLEREPTAVAHDCFAAEYPWQVAAPWCQLVLEHGFLNLPFLGVPPAFAPGLRLFSQIWLLSGMPPFTLHPVESLTVSLAPEGRRPGRRRPIRGF